MFILFESTTTNEDEMHYFSNWDAMGHTDDENIALKWKNENPNYRCYIYCPDKKIR